MATTLKKVAVALPKFEKGFNRFAVGVLKEEGEKLVEYVRRHKFHRGGAPGDSYIVNRTGRLSASVRSVVRSKGGDLTLSLEMEGPQAAILEYGGQTSPHLIEAKGGGVLSFFWEKLGKQVAFRYVHHPGSRFAPRNIFGSSIEEQGTAIVQRVEDAVLKEWERRIEE